MIYADYNSTTPIHPEVLERMCSILERDFGNPSTRHTPLGRAARGHIDQARQQFAAALRTHEDEVTFTSGATEACNLALLGVMERRLRERPKLLVAATEHPAILEPARACVQAGAQLTELRVDVHGRIDSEAFAEAMDEKVALFCLMLVNNETGVIQSRYAEMAQAAHEAGALVLCDATQALGKMDINLSALDVDFATFSAHKIYGPKGTGALWKRRGLSISPRIRGGGQEAGIRSGTENVAGIAGFGLAVERAHGVLEAHQSFLTDHTRQLEAELAHEIDGLVIQGAAAERIPGTSMLTVPGLPKGWLSQLRNIAASSGSSCASGSGKTSHVLQAMGVKKSDAANSIRISLGQPTTKAEVKEIATRLIEGANRLRENRGL